MSPTPHDLPAPTVVPVPSMGAEDVVVAPDGTIYTGTEDGVVWALAPDTHEAREVGRFDGRPLGLELLADGRVLVCDAHWGGGLYALDPRDGAVEPLVTEVEAGRWGSATTPRWPRTARSSSPTPPSPSPSSSGVATS